MFPIRDLVHFIDFELQDHNINIVNDLSVLKITDLKRLLAVVEKKKNYKTPFVHVYCTLKFI
jgi:hypothetical protein